MSAIWIRVMYHVDVTGDIAYHLVVSAAAQCHRVISSAVAVLDTSL